MSECIFCGVTLRRGPTGNRSREHVVPIWLQRQLGIEASVFNETRQDTVTLEESTVRTQNLLSFVAGHCCEGCNGGWMNDLELECSSLLVDLCSVQRRVVELSDREKDLLSRWAAKTAFAALAANASDVGPPLIHCWELSQLRSVPPGVTVVGNQLELGGGYGMMSSRIWHVYGIPDNDEYRKSKMNSYKVVIQLGRLILMVCYLGVEHWYVALNPEIHHQIGGSKARVRWMRSEPIDLRPVGNTELLSLFSNEAFGMVKDFRELGDPSTGRVFRQVRLRE